MSSRSFKFVKIGGGRRLRFDSNRGGFTRVLLGPRAGEKAAKLWKRVFWRSILRRRKREIPRVRTLITPATRNVSSDLLRKRTVRATFPRNIFFKLAGSCFWKQVRRRVEKQTTFVITNVGPSSAAKLQKRRKPAPTDFYNPPPSIITRDIQVSYNNAIISPGLKAPVEHSSHCFATRGLLRLYSRATLPLSRKLTFYQRLYFLHFKFPLITTERTRSLLNEFAFARV